ncbi:uncharacterized protein [Penaeus vannamei]|uniref:uncharacterized protein isoform X1 n=1 Tax=Penaeus vannamei TaxID=6689 RepID=UPI00387F4ECE
MSLNEADMVYHASGVPTQLCSRAPCYMSLPQTHGKMVLVTQLKEEDERSTRTSFSQGKRIASTRTQLNLWSVGSVEQKFIKLDPTSVKDVLIKRVFVQCVERKSLIQRATVSHLPKKNIYYYGEKFSYHYIILLLLVLSSVTP